MVSKNSKIFRYYNSNRVQVGLTNKSDITDKRGNWNHLKIIKKIPEQDTGRTLSEGTTESSHIGHCTYTAGSANVKVQSICLGK